jgi:hypothetical protein
LSTTADSSRHLLRHTVATVAYRAAKTLRDAPRTFATFHVGDKTRTPAQILAHLGDLFDWAYAMVSGNPAWKESQPLAWNAESERFFAAIKKFDDYLASSEPLKAPPENLFHGPVADALTHVGQLAMLRRLANAPIKGENYFKAEIVDGHVGPEQTAPRYEFE